MQEKPRISFTELTEATGFSRRAIAVHVKSLAERHIISLKGNNKNGYWEVNIQKEMNNERIHEFLITIKRNEDLDTDLDISPDTFKAHLDTSPNTSDESPDTFEAHLDTSPNTFETHLDTSSDTSDESPDTFEAHLDTSPDIFDGSPNTKRIKLTNKQKDIVNFCSMPRSSRKNHFFVLLLPIENIIF